MPGNNSSPAIKCYQLLLDDLKELTGHYIAERLSPMWISLFGDDQNRINDRCETVKEHLNGLFNDMVNEEGENISMRKESLKELLEKRKTLSEELEIDIPPLEEIDLEKNNLWGQTEKMEKYLMDFEAIKEKRIKQLQMYQNMEKEVCMKIEEVPIYGNFNKVPSTEELSKIECHIKNLINVKDKLYAEYQYWVDNVNKLIKQTCQTTIDSKLSEIIHIDNNTTLAKSKIVDLKDYFTNLELQIDEQKREILKLREGVELLWNLLEVENSVRETIIAKSNDCYVFQSLEIWNNEFQRCKLLKYQNIEYIINRLKNEIKLIWNDCHLGTEEMRKFTIMESNIYDETTLEALEEELHRIINYYNERKDIFQLATKWYSLWEKKKTFENRNNNVNRFNNRGGQLLKEERERKFVQKELPNIEAKLKKIIREFEEKSGEIFTYDGIPLMDTISKLNEITRTGKESEKENQKILICAPSENLVASSTNTPSYSRSATKTGKLLSARKAIGTTRRKLAMVQNINRRRSRSVEPKRSKPLFEGVELMSYKGFKNHIELPGTSTPCCEKIKYKNIPVRYNGTATKNNIN